MHTNNPLIPMGINNFCHSIYAIIFSVFSALPERETFFFFTKKKKESTPSPEQHVRENQNAVSVPP